MQNQQLEQPLPVAFSHFDEPKNKKFYENSATKTKKKTTRLALAVKNEKKTKCKNVDSTS